MMDLYRSLSGVLDIKIVCANPAETITFLQRHGIELRQVVLSDELTIQCRINRRQERVIREICETKGLGLHVIGKTGIYWKLRQLWHRPVLLIGLLCMMLLGMYVPGRVFFIQVEGNVALPQRQILEAAAECGIRFGADREAIRSEKMKNALLEILPQLQWAGVNTNGCVAVISVRERPTKETEESPKVVGSIIASRDGVITKLTAAKGSPVCKVGQAVKAGQILISGYTNCGISILAEQASGEVYAQTNREIQVICPTQRLERGEIIGQETKYSLIIGKNRINFCFGSGISGATCVKMYEENYLTLPGGFQLPVLLVKETILQYAVQERVYEPAAGQLGKVAEEYLLGQMLAGSISQSATEQTQLMDAVILEGKYACHEMIGQFRKEEIVKPDGTNH